MVENSCFICNCASWICCTSDRDTFCPNSPINSESILFNVLHSSTLNGLLEGWFVKPTKKNMEMKECWSNLIVECTDVLFANWRQSQMQQQLKRDWSSKSTWLLELFQKEGFHFSLRRSPSKAFLRQDCEQQHLLIQVKQKCCDCFCVAVQQQNWIFVQLEFSQFMVCMTLPSPTIELHFASCLSSFCFPPSRWPLCLSMESMSGVAQVLSIFVHSIFSAWGTLAAFILKMASCSSLFSGNKHQDKHDTRKRETEQGMQRAVVRSWVLLTRSSWIPCFHYNFSKSNNQTSLPLVLQFFVEQSEGLISLQTRHWISRNAFC